MVVLKWKLMHGLYILQGRAMAESVVAISQSEDHIYEVMAQVAWPH